MRHGRSATGIQNPRTSKFLGKRKIPHRSPSPNSLQIKTQKVQNTAGKSRQIIFWGLFESFFLGGGGSGFGKGFFGFFLGVWGSRVLDPCSWLDVSQGSCCF